MPAGSTTRAAIDVSDATVAYHGPAVLDGIGLVVEAGTIVALLGPSGCGKTTLLRAIAGLERLQGGRILVGGETVSGPGVHVAPERRRIGMVFQDWALFPHMSVARNVGYGLPRRDRRGPRVDEVLEMVGLGGFGDRAPDRLSGGQQQRVALARALAPKPSVLLLDEPFSNLDTSLRVEVRTEVHRLLADLGVTTVFVTHDQDEAFVLGDEVAVMTEGRIVQKGSPATLYAQPVNAWVATFVGEAAFLDGEVAGDRAQTSLGSIPLRRGEPGAARVMVRPEDIQLSRGTGAEVQLVEYYGHDTTYDVQLAGAELVRVRSSSAPVWARGDQVAVRYVGGRTVAFAGATDAPTARKC